MAETNSDQGRKAVRERARRWLLRTARSAIRVVPSNRVVYGFCKFYVDQFNGQNDSDMRRNGELRLMRELLPNCRTVLDVGANAGQWAQLALQINPRIELHCFEPNRAAFAVLSEAPLTASTVRNNVGIGEAPSVVEMHVFAPGSGMNSLYSRDGIDGLGNAVRESVNLVALDDYCRERSIDHVDLLKLDVEGHELAALRGARELLEDGRVLNIQFEYGGCNIDARVLLKDLFKYVHELNERYTFYKVLPKGLLRVDGYSPRFENFQYQNWLVKRD